MILLLEFLIYGEEDYYREGMNDFNYIKNYQTLDDMIRDYPIMLSHYNTIKASLVNHGKYRFDYPFENIDSGSNYNTYMIVEFPENGSTRTFELDG